MTKDPTPLATGPTKWRAENCTTHHHACDCREWEHANEIERLQQNSARYEWLRWRLDPEETRQLVRYYGADEFREAHEVFANENDKLIDAAMNGANA